MKKVYLVGATLFYLLSSLTLLAQEIRVEGFVGNESPSIDVFWVEPFVKGSQFLFLSRNTYTITDYDNERGNFSTLNIAAYQIKKTGFGIALAVTATSNAPFQTRSGIQFLKVKPKKWLVYSILSSKIGSDADARWLNIAQWTPALTEKLDLFMRAEWVTSIGFRDTHRFSASIVRLGFQIKQWQFGPGADFLWTGSEFNNQSANYGVFITHLF